MITPPYPTASASKESTQQEDVVSLQLPQKLQRIETTALLSRRTVVEFFAGIGLMRMGLERQGWKVLLANDIDEQKEGMYRGHFYNDHDHFIRDDIHNLDAKTIPHVTLATASFPCTDLSLAGGRNGLSGKQSSAFWGFTRLLGEMNERRPPLILLENVPGFLTSHKGQDFHQAMLALNQLGYHVDAFIINAAHFVPQSRERVFIVGAQSSLVQACCSISATQLFAEQARPISLVHYIQQHQDIVWNLRMLPSLPRHKQKITDVLEELPDNDKTWWSAARALYLLSQMSSKHREMAECMISGDEWTYGTVFRRMRHHMSMAELRTDNIAGCLRTPKGGSAKQILFKAGHGRYQVRLLSAREAARLMGADQYILPKNENQALFGFGDAVCVPVIEWIVTHYLECIISEALSQ